MERVLLDLPDRSIEVYAIARAWHALPAEHVSPAEYNCEIEYSLKATRADYETLANRIGYLVLGRIALAQGSRADYERSASFRQMVQGKVTKARVEPHWFDDNKRFWYRNDLGNGSSEFVLVDTVAARRESAFDHAALAKALSKAVSKDVSPKELPFAEIEIDEKGKILFHAYQKYWQFDPASDELSDAKSKIESEPSEPIATQQPERRFRGNASPDRQWTAAIKDHNLVIRSVKGEETPLTTDGTAEDEYAPPFYWSPDSTHLVTMKTKHGDERKINMVESSPRDQLQPRLMTMRYDKPGDKLTISWPHLFDVQTKKEIAISNSPFSNPFSIDRVRWRSDSSEFWFLYNQRGHQVLRLVGVDAKTGAARAVIDEQSKTFIDYAGKMYQHEVPGTGEIIWMSERDGWNHLYLYDSKTGKVINQITKGEWVVRGVERVDDDKREIIFRAGGIYPEQNPYYVQWCKCNFDGTSPIQLPAGDANHDGICLIHLTEGDGNHTVRFSPDRHYFIDTWSRVDLPPVNELRRTSDGKLICTLETADASALASIHWQAPERFVAKGRDDKTDIYGVIFRPTNFDASKKYPVIEDIYAGPQGSFVPVDFAPLQRPQLLAELGFIVVQIDGMGTSNRSKAFHDVCWKNLGDAGFPDRIRWIKAAAAKYPYMDLTRVGIYGTSAGGQSSLGGMLMQGDFYKVCVSACGCHDNRMDKVWWNELWMGYPIGPHYAEQSNVTNAHKLTGKLLLIVGELDRNVDPASTMQVVNALIKANKDFDLLVVPGAGHGLGGAYGQRRLNDFFVRHLLGVEPRHE